MAARLDELLSTEGPLPLEDIERKLPPRGTDLLARTLWGEGRSEGAPGMQAIANVVMNRTKDPEFSRDPEQVATNAAHFAAWKPTDPNYPKMQDVTEADENFKAANEIARKALSRQLPDETGGATHYIRAGSKEPPWTKALQPTKAVGKHQFYRKPARQKKAAYRGGPKIEGSLD